MRGRTITNNKLSGRAKQRIFCLAAGLKKSARVHLYSSIEYL